MARLKTSALLAIVLVPLSGAIVAGLYFGLLVEPQAGSSSSSPAEDKSGYHIAVDSSVTGPRGEGPKRIVLTDPREKAEAARRARLEAQRQMAARALAAREARAAEERGDDAEVGDLVTETARLYGRWLKEYQQANRGGRLSPKEKQKLGQRYQQEFMPRFLKLAADKKASMAAIIALLEDPETENKPQVAQMLKSLANYPSGDDADMSAVNDKIFALLNKAGAGVDAELRSQLLMGLQVKSEDEQRRSLELFIDIIREGKDEGLRAMALYKLARFSIEGAREEVRRRLSDASEPARVRVAAIQAIDFSSWPEGLSLFRGLTEDPDASVRQSAYGRAYQMTNGPELRQTLQDALLNERDTSLLSSLQYSLQIHGDEETMGFLRDVARNDQLEAPRRVAAQKAYAVIKQRLDMAKAQEEARRRR